MNFDIWVIMRLLYVEVRHLGNSEIHLMTAINSDALSGKAGRGVPTESVIQRMNLGRMYDIPRSGAVAP
jgi:hypothetical protein